MSDTISNLIAFVGFLIIFSKLVQAVQEALKNWFKLKTAVWERFFVNLYRREFLPKETSDKKSSTLNGSSSGAEGIDRLSIRPYYFSGSAPRMVDRSERTQRYKGESVLRSYLKESWRPVFNKYSDNVWGSILE